MLDLVQDLANKRWEKLEWKNTKTSNDKKNNQPKNRLENNLPKCVKFE